MKSAELRQLFLDFYQEKGHTLAASGSLVPASYDPSVLLTTAGMQPLKPYFLGQAEPPAPRLTTCQKCFRTPDIDEVGSTARHLTFFEMLGNFSFGDYFKAGAIEMAWELITQRLELDPERLWITVFQGDDELGVGYDQEAADLWVEQGVPRERIVGLGEDNFWKAGPTGPCGPCTEIYMDRGEAVGCGRDDCKPGCDCDRFLEFYNLVFMQYDRDDAGVLTPLPKQNIDTGMGLERISTIVQDAESIYDTDGFQGIIEWVEKTAGVKNGSDPTVTKALRILADHGRGMMFLASDGVAPSNEGRGYVLRRIVRRAVLQADRIGLVDKVDGSVLEQINARVVEAFGEQYPELVEQQATVVALLAAEEERFLQTLASGSALLQTVVSAAKESGASQVSGADAFKLHDTFGFPIEMTEELAREAGLDVDRVEFNHLMQEQRERARAAAGGGSIPADVAAAFGRENAKTEFVGYSTMEINTSVVAVRELEGNTLLVKLAASPFYAQGGGQVSDAGTIDGPSGRARVIDVLRFEDDQVLAVEVDGTLAAGDAVTARVDPIHRLPTQLNHTATHLLHKALRDRLGDHVRQAGSLVAPDRLRFDFAHGTALTADELDDVERAVNAHIALGEPVRWSEISIEEARERGAMMLFGEKYGDRVRFVEVGEGYSRELCGGTHVDNTARIQLFVVTAETSVGADARRIEAVTGDRAIDLLRDRAKAAEAAAAELNVPVERLAERAAELSKRARMLERELSSAKSGSSLEEALGAVEEVDGVPFVVFRDDALSGDELLELSDKLRGKVAGMLLASGAGGKVSLVASMADSGLERGAHAGDLIKQVAPVVGGGGGGRPNMARAGGKDVTKLDDALAAGRTALADMLTGAAR